NGDRIPQWYAKHMVTNIFNPVPDFDFIFCDVVSYQPTVVADWNRNGTDDAKTDAATGLVYRAGNAGYWTQLNASKPGLMIMGNVNCDDKNGKGGLRESEYQ